jgi:endonuclease/exonuclease/phosphatase (EEP) superfamily protein YafD
MDSQKTPSDREKAKWEKYVCGSPQGITQRLLIVTLILSSAGNLGEWHQYFELASHFKVQYLVLSLGCFGVLFGLTRSLRNPWVWLSLLCFGLNAVVVLPWYFPHPIASGQTLRVIVANVLTSNQQYEEVVAWVKTERPAILMTMEVNATWAKHLESLKPILPYSLVEARDDNFGIALYSALPLEQAHLKEWNEGDLSAPSIVADVKWQDQRLKIVATHPLPPTNSDYFQARNAHLQEMARDIQTSGKPTIVLGDLNLSMWSPYYRQLVQTAKLTNSRQGFGIQPTWGHRTGILTIPIDHCLITRPLQIQNSRVGSDIGSDHRPLVVDVTIAQNNLSKT